MSEAPTAGTTPQTVEVQPSSSSATAVPLRLPHRRPYRRKHLQPALANAQLDFGFAQESAEETSGGAAASETMSAHARDNFLALAAKKLRMYPRYETGSSATGLPIYAATPRHALSPNTTEPTFASDDFLVRRLHVSIKRAYDERFEAGVQSVFSQALIALIETHGNAGVGAVETILSGPHINAEITAEILRWLPFIKNSESYKYRLALLRAGLASAEVHIRDAAIMALAYLADVSTADAIELAIEREQCADLRRDLEVLSADLHRKSRGLVPPTH